MSEEKRDKKEEKVEAQENVAETATVSLSSAVLEALRLKAAKADEYLDLAKRAKADFINYQDRVRREKESLAKYSMESFVREFLPALDSLDLSLRTLATEGDAKKVLEGVRLIEKEFLRILAKSGVRPIDAEGRPFDPAFHEAVSTEESSTLPEGQILEVLRRGWMIHDRVLRPAGVRVTRKPAQSENNDEGKEEKSGKP